MADSTTPWLVFDVGSHTSKLGFGGEDEPRVICPTIVESRSGSFGFQSTRLKTYGGTQVLHRLDLVQTTSPVSRLITNFDAWTDLMWYYFEQELVVDPSTHGLFLTEAHLAPRTQRQKMLEISMEEFKVNKFFIATAPVLSLYSEGMTTGIAVDLGKSDSYVLAVVEGYALPHASEQFCGIGSDADELLMQLLKDKGHSIPIASERWQELVDMKSHCAFVRPMDPLEPLPSRQATSYTTKSGQTIDLGDQWDFMTNLFFQPKIARSLDDLITSTARKCFADQKELLNNILITGGCSMVPGFQERLKMEIQGRSSFKIGVSRPPLPIISAWKGASILTGLSSFEGTEITPEEYDEIGPSLVHRKCYF